MKNCKNCGHRKWDTCMLSGNYCNVERRYPIVCGKNFEGWVKKEPRPVNIKIILSMVAILLIGFTFLSIKFNFIQQGHWLYCITGIISGTLIGLLLRNDLK